MLEGKRSVKAVLYVRSAFTLGWMASVGVRVLVKNTPAF